MSGRIRTGKDLERDTEVVCDVCVVGSGAGGAVLAEQLVSRGLHVVMLEEGGYHTRAEFDMRESWAYPALYQEMGNRATDDQSVLILQGRSVGGGTTVNWCTSFRTPRRVLDRWASEFGVEGLTEAALTPHWEALEQRLHIREWPLEAMNRNNQVLWEGCGKLGFSRGLIRRNVNNCADLGKCGLGCPIDAKQSMLVTLIPDAVEKGMDLYANASARRLLVEGRKVRGVEAQLLDASRDVPTGVTLTVRAKTVAVCGGAINSPALLLRSGLTGRGNVGKRLFLHPTVIMSAQMEQPVEAWAGAPQAVYSHHFIDRGPQRTGYFLEVPPLYPMIAATVLPGFGVPHQKLMERLPYTQVTIAITADGFVPGDIGGTVRLADPKERRVHIEYPLQAWHWEAFRDASETMARVQFAGGAKEVISLHASPVRLRPGDDLGRLLGAASWEPGRVRVATAHQMGGCCMGKDAERSVVDSSLRYHELDNLFVVDGSVLPTSLGVNPQETIFGIARLRSAAVAASVV
ncbi:MAG: GMC family oxidoreductase N-terminal domain-containing protein [Myxococcaceae bacterium]